MSSSRRMAAAVSALAVVAGGLVSAAVIGVGPALADHCDPAEATASPTQSQQRQQQRRGQETQAPDGQDDQSQAPDGQDGGQDGGDQRQQDDQQQNTGQESTGQESTGQQDSGGGALEPAPQPEEEAQEQAPAESAQPFSRRRNTPTPSPTASRQPTGQPTGQPTRTATSSPSPTDPGEDEEHNECADLGPFVTDFIDIRQVPPSNQLDGRRGRNGSRGTFVSSCGTNRNGHNNPDNFIVAPGVSNGAHHLHDYVGNLSTDAFSTDESLAAAGTTCRLGDRSTYFWPVLRDRKVDVNTEDPDGNVGQVLRPRSVTLQFRGNATSRVSAMPRFLRIITGDAKAATNGGANARAAWTCTGFNNRITTKYPLCPRGSQVARILDFPSCWDGQNTDSANHRTHIVFPGEGGACPQGTRAVPQLRMTLTYTVPQGPSYALDAFPEQLHNPVTDHADFANVMPDRLMSFVVNCINRGRRC
ncbi:DUF1996 domain-containing protein [Nonomuraea cavernae]|uniref:DUF1996 domain-containing protein n=1 Tax=Nonomuraea cavernae TaxID=2045107 RepID=A0A918DNK2_9ACTN|nr:DUF1996 domain-containing protein [Nonomuraea cavernae]MCA2185793.1 DUF1996 domain-containing protein [Nonomuraea cavernae]GGO75621.1 hypothetical protein GCM10012289_51090 [Nonomuraea cavernae]